MISNSYLAYHNCCRDKWKKGDTYPRKGVERMNKLYLGGTFIYPTGQLVGKIALSIEDDRVLFLPINISANNASINQVEEIEQLVICVLRYIDDIAPRVDK